jgi:GntR family transcriptional regulator
MIIELDPGSHVPPYEQIREQIATMIGSGVLADGTRLPSIRQLAADLGVAANTVARSYRELETANLVVSRVGKGTAVTAPRVPQPSAETRRRLRAAADAYLATARRLGVTVDEAIDVLRTPSN